MPIMQNAHKILHKYRGSTETFADSDYQFYPVIAAESSTTVNMGIWVDPSKPTVGHLIGWFKFSVASKSLYDPYTIGTISAPSNVNFSATTVSSYTSFSHVVVSGKAVSFVPETTPLAIENAVSIAPLNGTKDSTITVTQS